MYMQNLMEVTNEMPHRQLHNLCSEIYQLVVSFLNPAQGGYL